MHIFKFENGETLKDKVTGFKGVVMSRANYLTGCDQYALLQKQLNDKGKPESWEWFDENRLTRTKTKTILIETSNVIKGGPQPTAPEN